MDRRFNIAKYLYDKKYLEGLELFDRSRDISVTFVKVTDKEEIVCDSIIGMVKYTPDGKSIGARDLKTALVPHAKMCDWSKFFWKKGDILVNIYGIRCIFLSWSKNDYTAFFGKKEEGDGIFEFRTRKYKKEKKNDMEKYKINPKTASELMPMDWCLMRDTLCEASDTWELCQYAYTERFMVSDTEEKPYYHAVGGLHYDECIPYNDQTAHLLGTREEWKGEQNEGIKD